MEKEEKSVYVKRSQKDYSMSFKLEVVKEIESGILSTIGASETARKTKSNVRKAS